MTDQKFLHDGDDDTEYHIAIRRDPPVHLNGTPEQLVRGMREDYNRELEEHNRETVSEDARYMYLTAHMLLRRSGVTPKWKPNDTPTALQFLGYLHYLGAITSTGASEIPVDYEFYNEVVQVAPLARTLVTAFTGVPSHE